MKARVVRLGQMNRLRLIAELITVAGPRWGRNVGLLGAQARALSRDGLITAIIHAEQEHTP